MSRLPPSPLAAAPRPLARRSNQVLSVPETSAQVHASYSATQQSRFRRTRYKLGGGADAHYALGLDYYQIREYARDMDRNDQHIGQMIDRAVDNIGPLELVPMTGDAGLDREIKDRWREHCKSPRLCDADQQHTFRALERLVQRHLFVDGDVFVLPVDGGAIQVIEGDLVDSPRSQGDVVHGVQLVGNRPVGYWFLNDEPMRRTMHGPRNVTNYTPVAAVGPDGLPNVFHIFDPKRVTQHRGVTVFKAALDVAGMVEDMDFAVVLKQQIAACIGAFIKSVGDTQWGSRSTVTRNDALEDTLEEMSPGMIPRLRPGEDVVPFTPSVQANEYGEFTRNAVRKIGLQVGLPLSLAMLDTSQTTFHGYRGELQQARLGFGYARDLREERFNRPVYAHWLREQALTESAFARAGEKLYRHKWNGRRFPYVEPKTDAEADKVRLDNLLISPRDLAAERGDSWEDIVAETVADRGMLLRSAIEEAKAIEAETGVPVGWRDLLNLSTPQGMQAVASPAPAPEPPPPTK